MFKFYFSRQILNIKLTFLYRHTNTILCVLLYRHVKLYRCVRIHIFYIMDFTHSKWWFFYTAFYILFYHDIWSIYNTKIWVQLSLNFRFNWFFDWWFQMLCILYEIFNINRTWMLIPYFFSSFSLFRDRFASFYTFLTKSFHSLCVCVYF